MVSLRLMAVGDISLQMRKHEYPFKNVKEVFDNKDVLFGNLETVLSTQGVNAKKSVVLQSHPKNIGYLKDAKFDVLNFANNHVLDLGVEGFKNTLDILKKNNFDVIGANDNEYAPQYLLLERNEVKLGFLGYTIGRFKVPKGIAINKIDDKNILADIEHIKNKCDFIIVSLHWGTENVFYPSPKQIDLAHSLIDHGATLILGHHPHVIQGIEKYNDGLIAYSLGNFQFDPKLSQSKTNESIILNVNFDKNGIKDYDITPVIINDDFSPVLIEGEVKEKILNFVSKISLPISKGEITNKWWFEEIGGEYLSGNMNSYVTRIKRYGLMPLLECCVWLIMPFCIRCYAGILRRKFSGVTMENIA